MGHKNKLGLSLSRKKGFFGTKVWEKIENNGQKLTNLKKKDFFWPKKQAGVELQQKKRISWA